MYIVSNESDGQLGLLSLPELKVGKNYSIMDTLYKEKGFLKIDEVRRKHRFVLLVADKWGNRPRTFDYEPGLADLVDEEIIGNIILTPGYEIIMIQRIGDNKEDPYITIMEVTNLFGDIDVKVKERFRPAQYGKHLLEHRCGIVLRLGMELLDTDEVNPNMRSLYRTLEDVELRNKMLHG